MFCVQQTGAARKTDAFCICYISKTKHNLVKKRQATCTCGTLYLWHPGASREHAPGTLMLCFNHGCRDVRVGSPDKRKDRKNS